jgi:Big-like domain-containing protein
VWHRENSRSLAAAIVSAALAGAALSAQPASRIAATPAALRAYAIFFHGKQVVVRSALTESRGVFQLEAGEHPIFVFWKDQPTRGEGEIRGEFWDLGRLQEGDSRFTNYDFKPILEAVTNGRWPGRDEIYVILGATLVDAPPSTAPTVREIALSPAKFADRGVTLTGRFRGRNLYGDVPAPLNRSQWDFVLQSADGALWVSGLRPRGKGFDLDPGTRSDTGRWLEVTGTVHVEGVRVWVQAESIQAGAPPTETTVDVVVPPPAKEAPPTIIFSAPIAGETDVEPATTVRVQFSRDMDPKSLRDRVRVTYLPTAQGPAPAPPAVTATYREGNHSVELKFTKPLERFQVVKIELLEGITASDGQPLQPWAMTFTTGG